MDRHLIWRHQSGGTSNPLAGSNSSFTRIDPPLSEAHEVIVLDTNLLSEALQPTPPAEVFRWFAAQTAEATYGVEAPPPGKRRTRLLVAVAKMFAEQFEGRMLPFDEDAARLFASIVVPQQCQPPNLTNGCRDSGDYEVESCVLSTRNTGGFDHCGIQVINPWAD